MKIVRLFLLLCASLCLVAPAHARTVLEEYLPAAAASDLVPGAEGFGPIREDLAVAPVLKRGQTVAWVFMTSDFVGTTGYSGKPIHTLVAIGTDARIVGVKLVKHSEPIVLIGIPETKVNALVASYAGLDIVAEAKSGGTGHEVDIISGATVTVMVIDDSIVRSGLKVARALGLGGLAPEADAAGPRFDIDRDAAGPTDWAEAEGDGTLRRLTLDVAQVNEAFAEHPDERARDRAITEAPQTTFIDMQAALVSVPAIGKAMLGPAQEANLRSWLKEGENAIAIVGRGLYSFKGSGYVRGGIFDRIVLIHKTTFPCGSATAIIVGSAALRLLARRNFPKWTCSAFPPASALIRPSPSAFSFWHNARSGQSRRCSTPSISATSCRRHTCARSRHPCSRMPSPRRRKR